jgi:hypothetical protein
VDFVQARPLGGIDPTEWTSDTRFRAGRAFRGRARRFPERPSAARRGELVVFLAGSLGAAMGDEGPATRFPEGP